MRVSSVITRLQASVEEVIRALSNRLTAADNWGPEGQRGQVLMSNGPADTDPPPSFQDITDLISSVPGLKGLKGDTGPQGSVGPQGEQGPPGVDGADGMVPTYVGDGETFTVPEFKQALYALPIVNDGSIVVTGDLVMVD